MNIKENNANCGSQVSQSKTLLKYQKGCRKLFIRGAYKGICGCLRKPNPTLFCSECKSALKAIEERDKEFKEFLEDLFKPDIKGEPYQFFKNGIVDTKIILMNKIKELGLSEEVKHG